MPRANRICFAGALYHILQRGNSKQAIFVDDVDRWHFLKLLLDAKSEYDFLLHCYVLLHNHFHLIIETPNSTHISKIMQLVEGSYAMYFNKRHDRVGHLYQGRFKDIIVEKDAYLLGLSRYVHLNPVKAGLVVLPSQYQWSSYNIYTGARRDILVNTETILSYFGNVSGAVRANDEYKNFVEAGISNISSQGDWLEENLIGGRFLASRDFLKRFIKGVRPPL